MVKMPYESRDPLSFRRLVKRVIREDVDCGYYKLDCTQWTRVRVVFVRQHVRDRLSGLTITVRKPVLVFEKEGSSCSVEAVWDGEAFRLDCERLRKCCVTRGP